MLVPVRLGVRCVDKERAGLLRGGSTPVGPLLRWAMASAVPNYFTYPNSSIMCSAAPCFGTTTPGKGVPWWIILSAWCNYSTAQPTLGTNRRTYDLP